MGWTLDTGPWCFVFFFQRKIKETIFNLRCLICLAYLGMQHDSIVNICVYYILVPYMYHTKRLTSSILDIQRLVKQDCFAPESRSRLPSNVTIFDDLAKDMSAEKKKWSEAAVTAAVLLVHSTGHSHCNFGFVWWTKILFWWCFILVNPAATWHQL